MDLGPFTGLSGAVGNVCTEDVLMLCSEIGIETGIYINAMIACTRIAEKLSAIPCRDGSKIRRAG